MSLSLGKDKAERYKNLAYLLVKYSRTGIGTASGIDEAILEDEMKESETYKGKPEKLRKDLEELGPTFIKFGQMLASRPDILPAPYREELAKLQDDVEPFPYEEVEKRIESELGTKISRLFESFEKTPMAAASLGQVHKAVMRNGNKVAVKIQRPGIRKRIIDDLDAFESIASAIDKYTETGKKYAFNEALGEFKSSLLKELDYRKEALNLGTIKSNLSEFENILVPLPVEDYTTDKVLTMEYIEGTGIASVSDVAKTEFDGTSLAKELFESYLKQVLVDGFFHADPHPGNIFLTPEKKLGLIDLGMVAYLDGRMKEKVLKIMLAISEGNGREAAEINLVMGITLDFFNKDKYLREISALVTEFNMIKPSEVNIGRILFEIVRISADNGLRTAPELTMLGKTLMNLGEIAAILSPELEPVTVIRENLESVMKGYMAGSLKPGRIFSSLLEANEFIQNLPKRLNSFLDKFDKNDLDIKIRFRDEADITGGIKRIANRITLGIIVASLFVGASMIMDIETSFKIFGYPALAIIIFFIGLVLSLGLAISIIIHDWRSKE